MQDSEIMPWGNAIENGKLKMVAADHFQFSLVLKSP
jgi:hypothetical protein